MWKKELKIGAILSYLLIIANSINALVIAPYILSKLGAGEYGVYKTIGALSASISVLELGLGGTMQRYTAAYLAQGKKDECSNFSAMGMIQAFVLSVLILFVGMLLFRNIDTIYGNTFSQTEIERAKQLYTIQILCASIHIYENLLFGIISGYNKFVYTNSLKLVGLFLKDVLFVVLLQRYNSSMVLVTTVLFVEVLTILLELLFLKRNLKHNFRLKAWDWECFKESFIYTILMFLQSLIIQLNGNVDNIVIGAVIGAQAVTVYSFAIQIFNMYEQLAISVSGVILPTITKIVLDGKDASDLQQVIVENGRIQWILLGGMLGGLICFGKEFFQLWLGKGFEDCHLLCLILVIPATFPLVMNTCLAILKAKNMLIFRTISLGYSAVLNLILTVIGTRIWGYWAAAAGTAISTIVASVISLNIYYQKGLKINIFKLYGQIMGKIGMCIMTAMISGIVMNVLIPKSSWSVFFGKGAIYLLVYGFVLIIFGIISKEKILSVLVRRKG